MPSLERARDPVGGDRLWVERSAMRTSHPDTGNLELLTAIKRYPKIIGYIFSCCPAILFFGYDAVIVGSVTAMPVFQSRYGDSYGTGYIIPATWLGCWSAASPIGIMVGSIAAGWVHDRFGRRSSLALGSLIAVVGVATCFVSDFIDEITIRRGVFLIGKLLEGKSTGMVICTSQTYISEISPNSLRPASFALFPIFTLLGQLVGAVVLFSQIHVPTPSGYLSCIASQWTFSIVLFIVAAILPESPTWLIRKDKTELALKSQRRLQSDDLVSDAVIEELVTVLEQEKFESLNSGSVTFKQCFTGTNRRRILIIIFVNLLPQVFGTSFLAGASYFFQTIGMDPTMAVKLLQVGLGIALVANIISIWTVSTFRRRPLIISTLTICGILYLAMGIAGFWKNEITLWWTLVSFIMIIFIAGLGAWPVSILVAAETSSLQLRGRSQAIGWLIHGLGTGVFSAVLPYVYNPDSGNAGGKTGFLFFGFCLISVFAVWAFIPEMKGRSQAEIDAMFTSKLPARQWRHWSSETAQGSKENIFVKQNVHPAFRGGV